MNPSIRETLKQFARQPSESGQNIWAWLAGKLDFAQSRPQAAPGIVISQLNGREGVYTILKNPHVKTYFRLSDRDYFIWQKLDGSLTVKDLVVAYFMEYKTLALGRVSGLIENLKKQYFLVEQPVDVYGQMREQLERRSPQAQFSRLWAGFIEKQFAINDIDQWLIGLYNRLGWLFYTRPALILEFILAVSGLFCFFGLMSNSHYGVLTIGGSALLGVVSLVILYITSIFIHEMSHALTVKHYRREVMRGGFMIYFGMPAFFVDTSDIWMEGKRARLAVTAAGPYADLIVGGLLSLVMFFFPNFVLNPLFFQFAFLNYISVLFNLNPLLELDGYFLLMDGLEIPLLRRKSLEFIYAGLWLKLKSLRESGKKIQGWFAEFSREERIFALFGLLASLWTAYAIFNALYFWQSRITSTALSLFQQSSLAGRLFLLTLGGLLGLGLSIGLGFALVNLVLRAITWARQTGLFATPRRKAVWAWSIVLLVGGLALLDPPLSPYITLLALAFGVYFTTSNARDYSGSRFSKVFWLMSGAFLFWWMAEASKLTAEMFPLAGFLAWLSFGMRSLASVLLVSAGLTLFSGSSLEKASLVEKIALAIGLLGVITWVAAIGLTGRGGLSPEIILRDMLGVLSLVTMLLMAPTLAAFWRTSTGLAVATDGLGLLAFVATALLGLPPSWGFLFLSAGFGLQMAAYRQPVTLKSTQVGSSLAQSDGDLLKQTFGLLASGFVEQFLEIDGMRQMKALEEQFNRYAHTAGWPIQIRSRQVTDTLPPSVSLRQMSNVYAAALNLLLDMQARQLGEKLTERALQNVYDALVWQMREIAAEYIFPEVKRARAIGQQFATNQNAYRLLLQRIPLFFSLSQNEIDHLASRLRPEKFRPGQVIIRQGARGDKFYIVTRGHVEVVQHLENGVSEIVNHHERGGYIGQVALLNDAPRNATCRAIVPTEVLSLSRADFNQLVKTCFELQGKIESSIGRMNLLRQIPFFADMDSEQLQLIAAQMNEESVEAGTIIIQQGEPGRTFYVIESGRVQISVANESGEHILNELGPGQFIGEMALLLEKPRLATARALEPTCMLMLDKTDFDRLVVPHLYASRLLEQVVSRRLIGLRRAGQT